MEAVNTDIPANREMVFDYYKKKIKDGLEDKQFQKKSNLKNINDSATYFFKSREDAFNY